MIGDADEVDTTGTPVGGGGSVARVKVAVTEVFELIVSEQVPVPEHAPDHPVKVEPCAGVAVSIAVEPAAMLLTVQSEPQLIPPPDDVTVPCPVPSLVTVKEYVV